jgi:hypothetical protein
VFIHRELLREEESVNLLREQVNQMRSLRMESDGKDAFILQLQTEVSCLLATRDENAELRARAAAAAERAAAVSFKDPIAIPTEFQGPNCNP